MVSVFPLLLVVSRSEEGDSLERGQGEDFTDFNWPEAREDEATRRGGPSRRLPAADGAIHGSAWPVGGDRGCAVVGCRKWIGEDAGKGDPDGRRRKSAEFGGVRAGNWGISRSRGAACGGWDRRCRWMVGGDAREGGPAGFAGAIHVSTQFGPGGCSRADLSCDDNSGGPSLPLRALAMAGMPKLCFA